MGVGALMLLIAINVFMNNIKFYANSTVTVGTVKDNYIEYQTNNANNDSTMQNHMQYNQSNTSTQNNIQKIYYPIIDFKMNNGKIYEFKSDSGEGSQYYYPGNKVAVRYMTEPHFRVEIDSFTSMWLPLILILLLGCVFTGIGIVMLYIQNKRKKLIASLKRTGRKVAAVIDRIELNRSVEINGRYPYQAVAVFKGQDEEIFEGSEFYSDNLWKRPSKAIIGKQVDLYIDRNDPDKYCMVI